MPPQPKPAVPHSMCPFMSGPIFTGQAITLFRAQCQGSLCRIFDDDTGDCRFNDVNYEDLDGEGAEEVQEGEVTEPEAGDEAAPEPAGQ